MLATADVYRTWTTGFILSRHPRLVLHMPELFGDCVDACEEMARAFPELTVTGGAAIVSQADVDRIYKPGHPWYEARLIHHTWCVDDAGRIIDPTKRQFQSIYGYITEESMAENPLLKIALSAAVPLWIEQLRERPDLAEYLDTRAPEIAQIIASKADVMMFGSKKKGEAADVFNATAEGIALMSFIPGGVTIFDMHFEVPHPDIAPDNDTVGALRAALEK